MPSSTKEEFAKLNNRLYGNADHQWPFARGDYDADYDVYLGTLAMLWCYRWCSLGLKWTHQYRGLLPL